MRRLLYTFTLMALLGLTAFGQSPRPDTISSGLMAITHVTLIPMTGEDLLPDHTVIVENGLITKIGQTEKTPIPRGALVVEGRGKYLMPGLAEMHAHIPTPIDGNDSGVQEVLFLYLANGVTTIRGMLGDPYHLQLKKQVANGRTLGPRIFTSSPSINGQTVTSAEQARDKVSRYQAEGYDFLKIHPGLTLDVFNEVVKTARKVNITFSGHIPAQVGIERAIEAGYASIDHLDGYVEGLTPASAKTDLDASGFFGFNFTDDVNTDLIPELAAKTKGAKIWIVSTQALIERTLSPRSADDLLMDPEMRYIPGATRYQWRLAKQNLTSDPGYNPGKAERFFALRQKIMRGLNRSKVGFLLGSDSPQYFNVPGFSIHREMQAMVRAGLSNNDVLRSGTVNPALFFKQEGKFGTISKGAAADLVLLSANPLENINNTQLIDGVMVHGQWLPKAYIQQRLDAIAAKNQ